MNIHQIPRLVIAGTNSGVGKTTIVTGLLSVLRRRGLKVQSYKVGPDYIDPGYHFLASGRPACNLDSWLVGQENLPELFSSTAEDVDLAVIEGVMGLYDGGAGGISSTASIAKLLKAPVILVLDVRSIGESAAAVALGYKLYDQGINLAGVILNRLGSENHLQMIAEGLKKVNIPLLGAVFRNQSLTVPERHLGLKPITEHDGQNTIAEMGKQMEASLDIEAMLAVANEASPIQTKVLDKRKYQQPLVRIAVARDEVFSFYYPASLKVLENYGAELVYFSPLSDTSLPNCDGLILGGGFPEMFLPELAANRSMHESIQKAFKAGMPIYAECGGFMYLAKQITDFSGMAFNMVGLVPAICLMEKRLQMVGYVEAVSLADSILGDRGTCFRGHEFHFSRMIPDNAEDFQWAFDFSRRNSQSYKGGYVNRNLLASYLHLHFMGQPQSAAKFISKCETYKRIK